MKNLILTLFLIAPIIGFSQSVSIQTAKKYAKLALQKEYGRENVRDINIEIIEWDYNYSTDRFDIYYRAKYETWLVAYWGNSNNKCQLKCDLDGSSAKFKFDGAFESWKSWGSIYSD